jgi:tetratricopeptide (TPR) repeat protein
MPETIPTSRGVFLSYAREDTEAARRIAEAMRASGLEVWFDENELRGGDAWDAKIRKQIDACALFIPIISAHTEERGKGYFRLEWKLAVDQTHLLAEGVPFVAPVVIDDTNESAAVVPPEFMRVQWTRLPGALPTPQFVAQVKRLLSREQPPAPKASASQGGAGSKEQGRGQRSEVGPESRKSGLPGWTWGALAAVVVGVAVVLTLSRKSEPSPAVAAAPAPKSEVRQLVEKAKALQEDFAQDDTKRDNLTLAEQLCKRAVELDPTDAEAWAVSARISYGLSNFDSNNEHIELGHSQVKRALQLAPDMPEVKLAQVDSLRKQGRSSRPEAERLIRELVQSSPTDKRVLRMMGLVLNGYGRYEEANVYFDRAAALPGGDSKALQSRATNLFRLHRYAEAEAAVNESLALRPTDSGRVAKLWFVMQRGELEAARKLLETVPPSSLTEQRAAAFAGMLYLWLNEPDACLAILRACPRDYFDDPWVGGKPKALFMGWAHQLAGRKEAAQTEWTGALRVVDQHIVGAANDISLLFNRAELLALTVQEAEAARAFKLFDQLSVGSVTEIARSLMLAQLLMDANRPEEALGQLEKMARLHQTQRYSLRMGSLAGLRFDPNWAAVRSDPRYLAVLKTMEENK